MVYVCVRVSTVYVCFTYEWSDCRGEDRTSLNQEGYAGPH